MAYLDARLICDQEVVGSIPAGSRSFMAIDHEMFSTVRRLVMKCFLQSFSTMGRFKKGLQD